MEPKRQYHPDRCCPARYKKEEHTKGPCDELQVITFWLDSKGCYKVFDLPSDFYTMIVTNPLVASWSWLLFALIMSILWGVLFNEHIIEHRINEVAFRFALYIIAAMAAAIYVLTSLRRGSMAESFAKFLAATRAIMSGVQATATPQNMSSEASVTIITHNNEQYVQAQVKSNSLPKRLAILLNALIVARRREILNDLQVLKLPLYADQKAEIIAGNAAMAVDTLFSMVAHLLGVMVATNLTGKNFKAEWLLANLHETLASTYYYAHVPRIFTNGAWWTQFVLTVLLPLLFASVYPGYSVVWIAPIVLNFYYCAMRYSMAQCTMMVAHRDNIWSDIETMRMINMTADANYMSATTMGRVMADFKNPPSAKSTSTSAPPTSGPTRTTDVKSAYKPGATQ